MEPAAPQAASLESLLRRECDLYREYLRLLGEERNYLAPFDAAKLEHFTVKRAEVYEAMTRCQAERLEIMRAFRESRGSNLRTIIARHFAPAEVKRLLPLCEELRTLARRIEGFSREHSQIVQFGLKAAHGLLSILWSASKSVLSCYDRRGGLHKSYQPVKSRLDGVLKRA